MDVRSGALAVLPRSRERRTIPSAPRGRKLPHQRCRTVVDRWLCPL